MNFIQRVSPLQQKANDQFIVVNRFQCHNNDVKIQGGGLAGRGFGTRPNSSRSALYTYDFLPKL